MSAFDGIQANADKAQREAELLAHVAAAFPLDSSLVKLAFAGGYKAKVHLAFTAPTRADALALALRFNPVPCLFYRGTFASFIPADSADKEREAAKFVMTEVKPVAWQASAYADGGIVRVDSSLICWADIGGVRCAIRIKIENDPVSCKSAAERDDRGRIVRRYFQWADLPMAGEQVAFAGGQDNPGSRLAYFRTAQPGYGF